MPAKQSMALAMSKAGLTGVSSIGASPFADFFSTEVFHLVLHNPTTEHRLLKFCQSRLCGENMEFLEKVASCCGWRGKRADAANSSISITRFSTR